MEDAHDLAEIHIRWDEYVQEAKSHWLTPTKVLFALLNISILQLPVRKSPLLTPCNGDILFYDREATPNYKIDGFAWAKKKNQDKVFTHTFNSSNILSLTLISTILTLSLSYKKHTTHSRLTVMKYTESTQEQLIILIYKGVSIAL